MQTRLSAAYKGLYALMMQNNGACDWRTGAAIDEQTYFDTAVDIHHIFPSAYCRKAERNLPAALWNSIVNKTPLSARTNRRIGGNAPSQYVPRLVQDLDSADRLDQLIRTHHADPVLLASDAFEPFIQQRARSMITLIEEATGRTVGGGTVEDVFSVGSARQAGEELDGDQN